MVEILGFVGDAAVVDSHRRDGALRSCCNMAGRTLVNLLDDC